MTIPQNTARALRDFRESLRCPLMWAFVWAPLFDYLLGIAVGVLFILAVFWMAP